MTHKVVITNAGNRSGDTVRVRFPGREKEEVLLRRGDSVEVHPASSSAYLLDLLCNPHGGDDTYQDHPQVVAIDKPTTAEIEGSG